MSGSLKPKTLLKCPLPTWAWGILHSSLRSRTFNKVNVSKMARRILEITSKNLLSATLQQPWYCGRHAPCTFFGTAWGWCLHCTSSICDIGGTQPALTWHVVSYFKTRHHWKEVHPRILKRPGPKPPVVAPSHSCAWSDAKSVLSTASLEPLATESGQK